MDTIFALASGAPPSAVSVIRVSGPIALTVANTLACRTFRPRVATLAELKSPGGLGTIDQGLVIAFPGPNSFTGDDLVEFQTHGSRAVVRTMFECLGKLGCRPARPGEFTRRAFLNGKLDLTAVEALGDLIDSETELQRRQAITGLTGKLFSTIGGWRAQLLEMLTTLEAVIDFVDEGDIPESIQNDISFKLAKLDADIVGVLASSVRGQAIRDGLTVVILGPPNAGKSALMNAIAGRDVAIVSARAGTTRDPLEIRIELDGLPVTFVDTAGLREASDEIEREGIRRARARSEKADLILWLSEGDDFAPSYLRDRPVLNVRTKIDVDDARPAGFDHFISTVSSLGVAELLNNIGLALKLGSAGFEPSLVTRSRQKAQIERALVCIREARRADLDVELISEELRRASAELDGLVGLINSEDILNEVFRTFCLGK